MNLRKEKKNKHRHGGVSEKKIFSIINKKGVGWRNSTIGRMLTLHREDLEWVFGHSI